MNALARYQTSRVHSASKPQIVVMLFQEVLRRLTLAQKALRSGDSDEARPHLNHARKIYGELAVALDDELAPELCGNLRRLYTWSIGELSEATRRADPDQVAAVHKVATSLLEGWREAVLSAERMAS